MSKIFPFESSPAAQSNLRSGVLLLLFFFNFREARNSADRQGEKKGRRTLWSQIIANAEAIGSNPVEAPHIFPVNLQLLSTAMILSSFKLLLYAITENWHLMNRLPCGPWQRLWFFPLVQTLVRLGEPCFHFSALLDVEQQVSRTFFTKITIHEPTIGLLFSLFFYDWLLKLSCYFLQKRYYMLCYFISKR